MARRLLLWAVAALIIAVAAPAMAGPADWQAAANKAAALVGGAPPPAVDVAAALAAGPDDANYWLAVGLTVKSGADVDYWLPVLVNGQNSDGSWGAGALATAGAVIGLDAANAGAYASQIAAGADWLAAHQVADGSWAGDAGDAYVVQALKAALAGAGAEDLFPPSVVLTLPTPGCYPGNVTPHVLLDIAGYATDGGSAMVKDLGFRFDGHQVGTDFSWTPSPGIANTSTVAKKFDPVSGAVTYRWQPAAPGVSLVTAAGNLAHGTYKYLVTFTMPGGVSDAGAVAAITTIDADPLTVPPTPAQNQVTVTVPLGVPACTDRTIYGTDTNGTTFHLLHAMGDNSTLTWIDNTVRPLAGGAPGAGTEYPDPTPAYGGPLPVPDASHLVTIVADDWTVPTNTSIASKTITMESTPPDVANLTAVTPTVIPSTGPDAGAKYVGGLSTGGGTPKWVASFTGQGRDVATGCGLCSLQFFGDKFTYGLGSSTSVSPPEMPMVLAVPPWVNLHAVAVPGTELGAGDYKYMVTFYDDYQESVVNPYTIANLLPAFAMKVTTNIGPPPNQRVDLTNIPIGPPGTVGRKIYRTKVGGGTSSLGLVAKIPDNVTTIFTDTVADADRGDPDEGGGPGASFAYYPAAPFATLLGIPALASTDFKLASVAKPGGTPGLTPGNDYIYAFTFVDAYGESTPSFGYALVPLANTAVRVTLPLDGDLGLLSGGLIPWGETLPASVTKVKIYRALSVVAPGVPDINTLGYVGAVNKPGGGWPAFPAGPALTFVDSGPDLPQGAPIVPSSYPFGADIVALPRIPALMEAFGLPAAYLPVWKAANPAAASPAVPNIGTVSKFTAAGNTGTYMLGAYETQVPEQGSNSLVGLAPYADLDVDLTTLLLGLEASGVLDPGDFAAYTAIPATAECDAVKTDPMFETRSQPTAPVAAPAAAVVQQLYLPPATAPDGVGVGVYKYRVSFATSLVGTKQKAISNAGPVVSITVPAIVAPPPYYTQRVDLSSIPLSVVGAELVQARRIYRTRANGTDFYLLDTIKDNTTTTYSDTTKDSDLGKALKTPLLEIPGFYVRAVTPRALVAAVAECDGFVAIKAFPRYWPVRGRYDINLQVRSVDCAGNGFNGGPNAVTLVVPVFSDVPVNDWAWNQVERIRGFKKAPRNVPVTLGTAAFPDTELPLKRFYAPDTPVKRYQMALFIVRAMGLVTDKVNVTQRFVDVSVGSYGLSDPWEENPFTAVNALFDAGISLGCRYDPATGSRYFCPNGNVTRAEMVTFLLRALGQAELSPLPSPLHFVDITGHWAIGWIEQAYAYNAPGDGVRITEGCKQVGTILYFCPNDWCTRREMAVFLTRAFAMPAVPKGPSDPW